MKAIQTRYKGYHFRSRLEARYAVLFDALKIKWDYEPEGFELGGGFRYLPDFFLHRPDHTQGGLWVEIKAKHPSDAELMRMRLLCEQSGHFGWFFVGTPEHDALAVGVHINGAHRIFPLWVVPFSGCRFGGAPALSEIKAACADARSARFEFGERGGRA